MRTADSCPICTTYIDASCIIYNGLYLSTIDVEPKDSLEVALGKINASLSTLQPSLGFTPENLANKSPDNTLGGATPSDTLYPTQKAVKDYVDNLSSQTKVYRARINMSDGSVQDLFENTLGVTLTWSVPGTGRLTTGTVTGLIGQNNVFCQISSNVSGGGNFPYITSISFAPSPWRIEILQADETGALVSNQQVFVEIVIYP
jgi:hypothetical protein